MLQRFVSGLKERASGDMPYRVYGLVNRPDEYDTPRSEKVALFISGHERLREAIDECLRRQAELDPKCWLCEVRSENARVCEIVTIAPWVDHSLQENPWRYYGVMGEREEPESYVTFSPEFASRRKDTMLAWARSKYGVVHWPFRFDASDYAYAGERLAAEPAVGWDDESEQADDCDGETMFDVLVPAGVSLSEGTGLHLNSERLDVQFLETARDLAQAILEFKGDLSQAPLTVQSDLKTKWALFEVLLPSYAELVSATDSGLASMPEPVPTVTRMLPWVVGMGAEWRNLEKETALRMLDDVQTLRPDLDVSDVRNAIYA